MLIVALLIIISIIIMQHQPKEKQSKLKEQAPTSQTLKLRSGGTTLEISKRTERKETEKAAEGTERKETEKSAEDKVDDKELEAFLEWLSSLEETPLPPNGEEVEPQKSTNEEYDYSEYDALFYDRPFYIDGKKYDWSLDMIGIPIDVTGTGTILKLQLTEEDRLKMNELEKRGQEAYKRGDMENYEKLVAEWQVIQDRSFKPSPTGRMYTGTSSIKKELDDGTVIHYYRIMDGSLIRKVTKPDGTVKRYVVSKVDPSLYPDWVKKDWVWEERP